MTAIGKIKKIFKSRSTIEGAGVRLKRAFGFQHVPMLDPFLLVDDFHSDYPPHYLPGFPWHPVIAVHRLSRRTIMIRIPLAMAFK